MMAAAELPAPEPMAAAAECVVPAAVMATAEMHTTEAMASPAEMAMASAAKMTAAECVVPAAVMATAEMHTTEAMTSPAEMAMAPAADMTTAVTSTAVTSASVTSASVTSASVTSASAAFRQRRARHHGRDHQNGNSNEGLRHGIARCAKPHRVPNDAGPTRKFPAPGQQERGFGPRTSWSRSPAFARSWRRTTRCAATRVIRARENASAHTIILPDAVRASAHPFVSCGGRLKSFRPVNIADVMLPPSRISVTITAIRCIRIVPART